MISDYWSNKEMCFQARKNRENDMSAEKEVTELEKMVSGRLYDQGDTQIVLKMAKTYLRCNRLNRVSTLRQNKKYKILKKLLGSIDGAPYYVATPITIHYGFNTYIGKNFVINYNCILQDAGEIRIGDDVMLAPNVLLTTELHPLYAEERQVHSSPKSFLSNHLGNDEYTKPIKIGNNVWLCSNVTVCPGVTIGDNSVIGAGSVVTHDIPPNVLACGVPCEVIREITDEDLLIKPSN